MWPLANQNFSNKHMENEDKHMDSFGKIKRLELFEFLSVLKK